MKVYVVTVHDYDEYSESTIDIYFTKKRADNAIRESRKRNKSSTRDLGFDRETWTVK
jgi:hypothetical protein